ncbi:hypothetical protein ACFSQJ_07105 [Croceitalea marina]|uniref:Uncharacterized protein n=1 Tax=Croceitalea marina TaxID=1775166 RepID=A0ABW5MVD9_9FLAO
MRKIFFYNLIMIMFLFLKVQGQGLPTNREYYKHQGIEAKIEEFSGSKYYHDTFKLSTIQDKLTEKEEKKYLRYDALNDFFEMKESINSANVTFLKKELGIDVVYDNKHFVYTRYNDDFDKRQTGYLHLIGQIESNNIYVKYGRNLRMPEKAKTTLEMDKKGSITNTIYYLHGKDANSISKIEINKKSILNLFAEKNIDKVKNFIKQEKLKFKKVNDLEKLIQFADNI